MAGRLEPYDPSPIQGWGIKVLDSCGPWRRESPRLVLQGPCPRCKDKDGIDEWIPEEVSPEVLAEDGATRADVADTAEEYVWCQCSLPHDATKTNKGCGAQGFVPVVIKS